jgi:hypothetical protein
MSPSVAAPGFDNEQLESEAALPEKVLLRGVGLEKDAYRALLRIRL